MVTLTGLFRDRLYAASEMSALAATDGELKGEAESEAECDHVATARRTRKDS